ncbi:GTPase [Allosalinactinospora lopnorensis]|uniref:GTPase n=1 Tax=Allosalinactinospora lopnorensis TaxID=1352348 RepID=UPI0009E51427
MGDRRPPGAYDAGWTPPAGSARSPNPSESAGTDSAPGDPQATEEEAAGDTPQAQESGTQPRGDAGGEGAGTERPSAYPAPHRAAKPQEGEGAEPERSRRPGDRAGAAAETPARGGRHAKPSRSVSDDPDDLADWVGSLADAVDEEAVIAGRHTASQTAAHGSSVIEPEGPADDEPATGDAEEEVGWAPRISEDDDPDEYRPSTAEPWQPMPATTRAELITRLDNLATLVELGRDDFESELIERARGLLVHAGARLRLSGEHTVVALAGGTGSGKSSLFNALCGLEFSRVGVTRPTTSSAHACVWGNEGADDLLEWLGVPPRYRHSRVSELDKGASELNGLILLDLPDHDSVRAVHMEESDRLISTADLVVWILDPQKYADAAVHHRYLAEMAGHGAVMVAVLNQIDRVEPEELEELLTDLRRLLETESGVHPRMLTTSTLTGQGLRGLRDLLTETVTERRVLIDRLVADLDQVVSGFERYRASERPVVQVPDDARRRLANDLVEACGVAGIAGATGTAYQRRGQRCVGWPVSQWTRRLWRDPLRAVQLDFLREGSEDSPNGLVGVQLPEVETAIAEVADRVGGSLPAPWPRRMRAAARSNVTELPGELGSTIAQTVPGSVDTPSWWQTVRVVQYLLAAVAGAGLAWFGTALVSWLGGGMTGVPLLDDFVYIGYAAAVVVATLAAGKLTDIGCQNLVEVDAAQRREQVEQQSVERVRSLTDERVVAPLEEELKRYRFYNAALNAALAKPA